jgi:ssDNA-binding Zn-finger/Zn-ribbon topoisomerase 1
MSTRKYNKKGGKTRRFKGGKSISSSVAVKLKYKEKEVVCDVCGSNHYTENTGAFGKSKLRSGVGQIFLGEAAEILDTTSVIIYTCNTCGLCKIVRNKNPIMITSHPV